MKRKDTPIHLHNEPIQDSELSFSSLFQKSTDPTSFHEQQLIHTMFDALRTGAFDDPDVATSHDWNLFFDSYNSLWRQCAMQIADKKSTREVFRVMCQSFRSDDPTEQLLYLLHTAETRTDMERIFSLLQQQEEEESNDDLSTHRELSSSSSSPPSSLERLCDKLWACTHCLLTQYSLAFQNKTHGNIAELETVTMEIVQEIGRLPSTPCHILSWLLLGKMDDAVMGLRDISSEDEQRFQTHFLVVMKSVKELIDPYPELPCPAPFPFGKGERMGVIPYQRAMTVYSELLLRSGDVGMGVME